MTLSSCDRIILPGDLFWILRTPRASNNEPWWCWTLENVGLAVTDVEVSYGDTIRVWHHPFVDVTDFGGGNVTYSKFITMLEQGYILRL